MRCSHTPIPQLPRRSRGGESIRYCLRIKISLRRAVRLTTKSKLVRRVNWTWPNRVETMGRVLSRAMEVLKWRLRTYWHWRFKTMGQAVSVEPKQAKCLSETLGTAGSCNPRPCLQQVHRSAPAVATWALIAVSSVWSLKRSSTSKRPWQSRSNSSCRWRSISWGSKYRKTKRISILFARLYRSKLGHFHLKLVTSRVVKHCRLRSRSSMPRSGIWRVKMRSWKRLRSRSVAN